MLELNLKAKAKATMPRPAPIPQPMVDGGKIAPGNIPPVIGKLYILNSGAIHKCVSGNAEKGSWLLKDSGYYNNKGLYQGHWEKNLNDPHHIFCEYDENVYYDMEEAWKDWNEGKQIWYFLTGLQTIIALDKHWYHMGDDALKLKFQSWFDKTIMRKTKP